MPDNNMWESPLKFHFSDLLYSFKHQNSTWIFSIADPMLNNTPPDILIYYFLFVFWDGVLLWCPDWSQGHDPPVSAFQVDGIMGMCHPVWPVKISYASELWFIFWEICFMGKAIESHPIFIFTTFSRILLVPGLSSNFFDE